MRTRARNGATRRREVRLTAPQGPISVTGTSSQPRSSSKVWRPVCRMQSVPMKTPRSRFRRTAYHIVDASLGPWILCQGGGGSSPSSTNPASSS
jgi:hypothetical protein